MTPAQKALLIAGSAAVAAFALLNRKASAGQRRTGGECSPYSFDGNAVKAAIDDAITNGADTAEHVAITVATKLYSNHPSGVTVAFPPAADAPAGARCVYERILGLAKDAVGGWRDIIDTWTGLPGAPEPGKFYKQSQGEIFFGGDGVVSRTLEVAGVPNTGTNRANYLYAMECSPFNDAVYNRDLDEAGVKNRARSGWPRGIIQAPQYPNNYLRAIQGKPFKRGNGNDFAFAWLPLIEPTPDGGFAIAMWPDGSSGINPPAEVLALGFEGVPSKQYGCGSDRYAGSKQRIP
jgi:hypothetical protein